MNYAELAETVTARLVAKIEAGAGTWTMPWNTAGGINPTNAITGKGYNGGNWVMLVLAKAEADHPTSIWATFKQWQAAGAQVRKGEHGTQIIKWVVAKGDAVEEGDGLSGSFGGRRKAKLVPKVYTVFNAAQVDGWTAPEPTAPTELDATAEAWIAATGATISEGTMACYLPLTDRIELPHEDRFTSPEAYYATAAHELVHWSGHKDRLNRDLTGRFGDDRYAAEELVAELGAAMVCAGLGIGSPAREDHAAYLAHWLRILKSDPKALFATASAASAAVTHLDAYSATITKAA